MLSETFIYFVCWILQYKRPHKTDANSTLFACKGKTNLSFVTLLLSHAKQHSSDPLGDGPPALSHYDCKFVLETEHPTFRWKTWNDCDVFFNLFAFVKRNRFWPNRYTKECQEWFHHVKLKCDCFTTTPRVNNHPQILTNNILKWNSSFLLNFFIFFIRFFIFFGLDWLYGPAYTFFNCLCFMVLVMVMVMVMVLFCFVFCVFALIWEQLVLFTRNIKAYSNHEDQKDRIMF